MKKCMALIHLPFTNDFFDVTDHVVKTEAVHVKILPFQLVILLWKKIICMLLLTRHSHLLLAIQKSNSSKLRIFETRDGFIISK